MRGAAFATDDGALRCYLDQLPNRCVYCARPTERRLLRIAGKVYTWSDGSWNYTQQVGGRVPFPACTKCVRPAVPRWIPAALGVVVLGGSIGVLKLYGVDAIWYGFGGIIIAMLALGIAVTRKELRVGDIDEDDHMLRLERVHEDVAAEVLALGAMPNPNVPMLPRAHVLRPRP